MDDGVRREGRREEVGAIRGERERGRGVSVPGEGIYLLVFAEVEHLRATAIKKFSEDEQTKCLT